MSSTTSQPGRNYWRWFVIPALATIASIFAALGLDTAMPIWAEITLAATWLLGLIYFLSTAIIWFVKKQKAAGWIALVCLFLGAAALLPAAALGFIKGMGSEMAGADDFAVNLKLPENIELHEPQKRTWNKAELENIDQHQTALRQSLKTTGSNDSTVLPDIPALAKLNSDHPDLLRHYLAVHPGWWYHIKGDKAYATRRWKVSGQWQHRLHAYYSEFGSATSKDPKFQTRTCLCMDGESWVRGLGKSRLSQLTSGVESKLPLRTGNSMHESHVSWDEAGVLVEIFEQSETRERRMTKASIQALQTEFAALLATPTWEHAKTLLPSEAIETGEDQFALIGGSGGGGIYQANIRCNPGEPGRLFLKAYEITGNTPLSARSLKDRSAEMVGWSKDPNEKFSSQFQFTIYEGEWGQFYGAKFEVWFQPENGKLERKLMESNWKIEGWTR